ncbi:MAG: bacteriocin [Clostridia bacterium]|nr:bacteriocin [Clostridia bacterium]
MWEQIFETAASSGIWAILFVTLFFIQIKDSKTREDKYQTTIDGLADKLKIVAEIHEDVKALLNKSKEK